MSVGIEYLDPRQLEVSRLLDAMAASLVSIPVLWNAWIGIRKPRLDALADILVSVALIAAWVTGDIRTAALVPMAMLVGHILEERSLMGSREAIGLLRRLTESTARKVGPNGQTELVECDRLCPGDRIELLAGDRLGADGLVESGQSSLDTSPVTGESTPIDVKPGDIVRAGSINLEGPIIVEVTHTGEETVLGQVVSLLLEAEQSKPPITRVLEKHASAYLPLMILISLMVLFLTSDTRIMMTVLIISCPCALALSAPSVAVAGLAVASRFGILLKGTAFLERLGEIDMLVLDKTGTITNGVLRVADIVPVTGVDSKEVLRRTQPLCLKSNHPVSRALGTTPFEGDLEPAKDVLEEQGLGMTGTVGDEAVFLGRAEFLRQRGLEVSEPPNHTGPLVAVGWAGKQQAWILFEDSLRKETPIVLATLRQKGIARQILVTGDREQATRGLRESLGLDDVFARCLPADKLRIVREELNKGRHPMVLGDGINDALALKAGTVGVAMGRNGTDIALASADVVLLESDLRGIVTLLELSRRARRAIVVNVIIALGWTMGLFALTALGFLGPISAALLHNAGTLGVIANAGRLLGFQPPRLEANAAE
jgi:heavy metal translocating P-type ATPase